MDSIDSLREQCIAQEADAQTHGERWGDEPWTVIDNVCEGQDLTEIARLMMSVRLALDAAEFQKKQLQKAFDQLRLKVIPDRMDEQDITSMKIAGLGRLGLTSDLHVSIVKDRKQDVFDWLRDTGRGDSVVETVNPSTLKAMVKTMMRAGEEVPDNLLNVNPFSRASITRS